MAKKQQDCCDAILKRLDKLDDILAALKGLQGENDRLKGDEADLRNQLNALKDQIAGMPKPLSEQATTDIAHKEAIGAVDEAQKRNKKYSTVGLSVGPNFGPNPTGPTGPSSINPGASTTGFNSGPGSGQDLRGNATVEANGRFFAPFGGDGTHAVQAQGEYMWNSQGQEGQFDVGLVNRWGNVQAGGFASFKYLNYRQYQQGGSLAEGAFLVDYLFKGGRVGVFGTQGFKNTAVLNMQELYPGVYNETYAHIINQYGFDAQVGVWGDAYLQGNIGVLHRYGPGEGSTPGGQLRLVQPIVPKLAFTAEYDYNASLVGTGSMLLFGLQVGNYIKPKEFADVKTPVPMDVPRIRYEFLTRRVGTAPPVADAGPPQIGVAAGIITLNGSGSHDPLGEPLTFSWKQIGGPSVSLSGANTATPTFMAAAGQYLRLPVDRYQYRWLVRFGYHFGPNPVGHRPDDFAVLRESRHRERRPEYHSHLGSAGRHFGQHLARHRRRQRQFRLGCGLAGCHHHLHPDRHRRQRHRDPIGNRYRGCARLAADCPLRGRSQYHSRRRFGDPELVHQ